jgi:hypothetical protein
MVHFFAAPLNLRAEKQLLKYSCCGKEARRALEKAETFVLIFQLSFYYKDICVVGFLSFVVFVFAQEDSQDFVFAYSVFSSKGRRLGLGEQYILT